MASAEVATFQPINNAHMDNVEFMKKAPPAPFSPDGAELPTQHEDIQSKVPTTLEVKAPTLPVPSIASRNQSRMEKKVVHEAESRKASIRRLASRAFEKQTGKQFTGEDMSAKEWDIYNEEVKKSEEILDRKKAEDDAAVQLANNIKFRENLLQDMHNELGKKVEQYQLGQEELTKISKDFEEAVQQAVAAAPPVTDGVKSSSIRMQQERQKKELKEQWRRSTSADPVTKARQRQFAALEDINQLKARIEELRKELGRMMGQAQKGKSSSHRMREEKEKKQEQKRLGIVPKEEGPVKVYVKKEAPQRSHMARMQEEQARKAEARKKARMSLDVSDIIGRSTPSS